MRELVPMLLVGLLVCQLIRGHLLEWYLVPSASMEPTLHGDPHDGDRVLVNKTAFWGGEPQRFDMVVLRHRDGRGTGQLVKRLIASGDDELNVVRIADGDVFLGRTRQDLSRVVKDPARARQLRLTHFVFPPAPQGATALDYFRPSPVWSVETAPEAASQLRLGAGAADLPRLRAVLTEPRTAARGARFSTEIPQPGHLSTRLPVDATFLDERGQRWGVADPCRDIGIELQLQPGPGCVGVQIVLEHLEQQHLLQCDLRQGSLALLPAGAASEPIRVPAALPPAGQRVTIVFGYLDGRFFAEVDGQVVLLHPHDLPEEPPEPDVGPTPRMPNLLHVGAAGGELRVERLRTFHDVHYKAVRGPLQATPPAFELEPGQLFLLGDNTFDSRDSRTGRTYARADLIGQPLAILGPAGRMRWLWR